MAERPCPSATHGFARLRACLILLGVLGCGAPAAAPDQPEPAATHATEADPERVAGAPSAAAPAPASAAQPQAPAKLNVLVITIDALRADMPWTGYPRPIAPNLTAFSKQALTYTRAYALSSYTAMSMGGFLAGRYPAELQRSGYFFSAYPDEELLFPEVLQAAGIRTLSAHAHYYFEEKAGFRQGFDDYRMVADLDADNTTDKNITSPQHLALAMDILSREDNVSGQFFAWFHFMDPHDEYHVHDGYQTFGSSDRDKYDNEVLYTDDHIGRLLKFVAEQPWGERTAIIISADHGEGFKGDKRRRHGFELWEPLVHVPLMLKVPNVAPKRIDTPRSHIDLAPTIFELLGVAPHPSFHGKSLLADARGEPEARDVIVDLPRTSDNDRRRAMISGRYKLISFGDDFRYQLFDVVADPKEDDDLRAKQRKTYEELKQRYLEKVKSIQDICPKMRHRLKGKRPEKAC